MGNLASSVTDEELKAFLVKYGFPPFDEIQFFPGDGSRPAALLKFHGVSPLQLEPLAARVRGVYWKQRALEIELVPMLHHERTEPPSERKHH